MTTQHLKFKMYVALILLQSIDHNRAAQTWKSTDNIFDICFGVQIQQPYYLKLYAAVQHSMGAIGSNPIQYGAATNNPSPAQKIESNNGLFAGPLWKSKAVPYAVKNFSLGSLFACRKL